MAICFKICLPKVLYYKINQLFRLVSKLDAKYILKVYLKNIYIMKSLKNFAI
jgi:hypothetical protein